MTLTKILIASLTPLLILGISCSSKGPPTSQSAPEIKQNPNQSISSPPVPESQSKIILSPTPAAVTDTPKILDQTSAGNVPMGAKGMGKSTMDPCVPRSKQKRGKKYPPPPESELLLCPSTPVPASPTRK